MIRNVRTLPQHRKLSQTVKNFDLFFFRMKPRKKVTAQSIKKEWIRKGCMDNSHVAQKKHREVIEHLFNIPTKYT